MRTLCAALALLVSAATARAGVSDKKLDIFWIDTEGGAATLFVSPMGESVLIDSGNPAAKDQAPRDSARILKVAAETAGLKKIDFLVTTHYHIDHFGGASELAERIPIGAVYDNGVIPNGRDHPSEAYLGFKCDKRVVYNAGDELPLKNLDEAGVPKLTIRCLCARTQTVKPAEGAKPIESDKPPRRKLDDFSDNANSIVQLISFGNFRMYVGGDITWNIEEKLARPYNLIGRVDVYQVSHHGLDLSNNPLILQACKPTVAIFSNGPTKGDMPETVATIKGTESITGIYQTHKNLRPGEEKSNVPDEFIANQEATSECKGNYIRCEVDADAGRYTFTIPATKHEQRYETKKS